MTTMAVVTCQQTPLQPLHIASTHSASIFCCCFFVFLLYTPISTQQWWPHASCYDDPPASRFNANMPSRFYFILLFFLYTWVPPLLWWQQWQQWQPCHHQHPTACPHWPHPKYWCQHTPSNLVSFFLHLSAAMITTGGGSHHHQCSIQLDAHTWSTHPQWQWSPSHPLALNHTAVHMHTQSTCHTAAVTMMTTNNFC